ncbi:phage protein [Paraburkholderia sediminicola]|uniref:phage protein n=1 Tax=Paraburkholderia sediminicola TaxID=458836 RepID=UPI0038B92172
MSTYSFQNFALTLTGPGGSITLGNGAGDAKEGVTFEFVENANTMVIGAGGEPMHSLNPSKGGKATVRLLKTSTTNGKLSAMYNFQRISSANWGQNVMAGSDIVRGEQYSCQQVAFSKFPNNAYAMEAGTIEWVFDIGIMDAALAAV